MEFNEIVVVLGIVFTSFVAGYLLSEFNAFRRYIKENCLDDAKKII